MRRHEGDWPDAEASQPSHDQGRPGFRRDGSGAPIAPFGHAGLENGLGPHLPDGRVEESLIPAMRALCAVGDIPEGGCKGFPPAPI